MNTPIPKGTEVRVLTNNGGDTIATLTQDYNPTYPAMLRTSYGSEFAIMPSRLKSIEPASPPQSYVTTYCNHGHRMSDGKPIDHECYVLPPEALNREWAGDVAKAIELLQAAKPLKTHRGVKNG